MKYNVSSFIDLGNLAYKTEEIKCTELGNYSIPHFYALKAYRTAQYGYFYKK
jgi:hypothetical protein